MTTVWQAASGDHMNVFPPATAERYRCPGVGARYPGSDILSDRTRMSLKSPLTASRLANVAELAGIDCREIETVFVCEEWSAELSTGLLRLGIETALLHGIAGPPCGVMDLIRLYDPADWAQVLQALEDAATAPVTFSFATTIRPGPGLYRPVFCFGQSEEAGGTINGTFAVARLCVEMDAERPDLLN